MPTTSDNNKNENKSTSSSTNEKIPMAQQASTSDLEFDKMKIEDVYVLSREFVKGLRFNVNCIMRAIIMFVFTKSLI